MYRPTSSSSSSSSSHHQHLPYDEFKGSIPDALSESPVDQKDLSHQALADLAARYPPQPTMTLGSVRVQVSGLIPHIRIPALTHARELSASGSGPTFSTTRDSIVQSLLDLALVVAGGTLPGAVCHIARLPTDVEDIILVFLSPRTQSCVRGVSRSMDVAIRRLTELPLSYFSAGRVVWLASEGHWLPGIILPCGGGDSSVLDLINPRTYAGHVGYHIQCAESNRVEYIPRALIRRHTAIGVYTELPPAPAAITHDTTHTPYGDSPHEVCGHGHYITHCGRSGHQPTAPSQCCMLPHVPLINTPDVGTLRPDIISTTRHAAHTIAALTREKRHGYAFDADGDYVAPRRHAPLGGDGGGYGTLAALAYLLGPPPAAGGYGGMPPLTPAAPAPAAPAAPAAPVPAPHHQ
jgi:hypothetical protein